MYKYIVVQSEYKSGNKSLIEYGIALIEEYDETFAILDVIPNVSLDAAEIKNLVKLCNQAQLDPIHLKDVIDDFLADN